MQVGSHSTVFTSSSWPYNTTATASERCERGLLPVCRRVGGGGGGAGQGGTDWCTYPEDLQRLRLAHLQPTSSHRTAANPPTREWSVSPWVVSGGGHVCLVPGCSVWSCLWSR